MRLIVRCIFFIIFKFRRHNNQKYSNTRYLWQDEDEVGFRKEYDCKDGKFFNKKLPLNYFLAYLFLSFDINKNIYLLLLRASQLC
jgi:hypothetical protein